MTTETVLSPAIFTLFSTAAMMWAHAQRQPDVLVISTESPDFNLLEDQPLDIEAMVLVAHKQSETNTQEELVQSILDCPAAQTTRRIVDNLQRYGYSVVDNFFPPRAHDEISREVQELIAREQAEKGDAIAATIKDPGPYMEAVIKSVSELFMDQLNFHIRDWHERHDWDNFKTIYWHQPIVFSEFQGFQAKQMRLREVGSNLGTHMDRSSAKLTVLYYPNEVWEGGELVAYFPPPDRQHESFKAEFEEKLKVGFSDMHPMIIEPKGNRLLVFWSDSIPHEVYPIKAPRLSFQVFFSGEYQELVINHQ